MSEWNEDEWGTRESNGVSETEAELAGFSIGERIIVTEDFEDGVVAHYEDEEGTVIGITEPREGGGPFNLAPRGRQLFVDWDDMDPSHIDPAFVKEYPS